jgi:hypothetical protein
MIPCRSLGCSETETRLRVLDSARSNGLDLSAALALGDQVPEQWPNSLRQPRQPQSGSRRRVAGISRDP